VSDGRLEEMLSLARQIRRAMRLAAYQDELQAGAEQERKKEQQPTHQSEPHYTFAKATHQQTLN